MPLDDDLVSEQGAAQDYEDQPADAWQGEEEDEEA